MNQIYNIEYSIPYFFVTFFLFVAARIEMDIKNVSSIKKIRIIVFLVLLLFIGLRGFVAWDWLNYYKYFTESSNIFHLSFANIFLFIDESGIYEPFFVIYTALVRTFTDNWTVFVFVSTLIDLSVLSYIFKRFSTNYCLSFLLFFALNIGLEFDLMRNIKALLMILLSLKYIQQRNLLKFSMMILVAFMFHRSALLFIPLYFIGNIELKKRYLVYFLMIINILYFIDFSFFKNMVEPFSDSFGEAVASKLYWYSQNEIYSVERGFTLGYFFRNISFILIIVYSDRIYKNFKYGKIMINILILYMIVSFVFNDFMVFVERAEILYAISFWFIWPYIIKSISSLRFKYLVFTMLILFSFLRIFKQTNNIMYEYENVMLGSKSYQQRIDMNVTSGRKMLNTVEK